MSRIKLIEETDVQDVVERVVKSLAADLGEAQVTLGTFPKILGVSGQIETLFRNLVDNAAKYAHPERPLRLVIDARHENGQWIFSVSDNGIGFPPHENDRIFDLFSRLHVDHAQGDGLGLALCRRIVHHHRGWITASSEPDQGSTFEFALKSPS